VGIGGGAAILWARGAFRKWGEGFGTVSGIIKDGKKKTSSQEGEPSNQLSTWGHTGLKTKTF